jgi:uncharacterized protein (TIGR00369 family)
VEDVAKLVRAAIVSSPYGETLGVACETIEEDRVRVRLPFRPEVTTIGDMVHGGAIASLVDVAGTGAAWANPAIQAGSRGTTIGFSIQFMAAARGRDVLADAKVIRRGGSVVFVDVDVHDEKGEHVARASVTYKLSKPR